MGNSPDSGDLILATGEETVSVVGENQLYPLMMMLSKQRNRRRSRDCSFCSLISCLTSITRVKRKLYVNEQKSWYLVQM